VGFLGALRNCIEESLLQDLHFESDFVVGVESIVACIGCTVIFLVFYGVPQLRNHLLLYSEHHGTHWLTGSWLFSQPGYWILILFGLFLVAIYGKETMQMKVTGLSSSLSRKFYELLYPFMTWIMSVVTYYAVYHGYGEQLNWFSILRLFGFVCVIYGTYLYRIQTVKKKEQAKQESKSKVEPEPQRVTKLSMQQNL
jgi:hypothetical protein